MGGEEKYIDTKISRTKGWHTVRFWITPGGGWAEIDDSTNQITYFNLSSLPIKDNQSSLTVSTDYELTEARYFRVGKWQNEGSFAIDQVSFDSLPPLPIESGTILSTFNGSVDWENYYSANFLDFYEDTSRFGNMERIDQVLRDPSNTTAQRGWWYESLSGLALAADVRYRQTNLPYYKSLVNNIVNFVITQNNQYPVPANDFFPLSMSATKYGEYVSMLWSHLTPENKALLKAKYISLLEEIGNEGWTRSRYIGDSTAEDYSWGPLYTNIIGSIAFSDHPSAQSWAQNGLTFARRALSTNSDEACSFCPNGKVGVKTIYAENETVRDCNPGETSENCMCIGDRAAVSGRSNSDFAYLVDNHDYSPHPNYMMSVLSGVQNSGYIIKIYRDANKDLPDWLPTNMADINPYTRKVWEKGLKSYDLAKNRYFGANIYRVRAKYQCDGQGYDVPQPYSQTNNSFRAKGLDDWGQLPTFSYNPSSFIRVKDLFGDTTVKDGTGRTYNIDELINKAAQTFFFKQFDSINTPVSPSVYIPSDKATIWGNINPFFVWNRQNGFHSFATRKGLIDTSVEFPLE